MDDAVGIYQHNLDSQSKRLWAHDYDGAAAHLRVPMTVEIDGHVLPIGDRAALLAYLETFRGAMDRVEAEAYHRLCLEARRDGDRIVGRHRTYMLSGGRHVVPPYDCEMTLVPEDCTWVAERLRLIGRNPVLDAVSDALLPKRERSVP